MRCAVILTRELPRATTVTSLCRERFPDYAGANPGDAASRLKAAHENRIAVASTGGDGKDTTIGGVLLATGAH
jgi:hypothetical protein